MTRKPVTRRTRSRSRSPVAADSGRNPMVQPGMSRMFVTTVPGLGPMVSRELGRLSGSVVRDSGFDGRSDVVCSRRPGRVGRPSLISALPRTCSSRWAARFELTVIGPAGSPVGSGGRSASSERCRSGPRRSGRSLGA